MTCDLASQPVSGLAPARVPGDLTGGSLLRQPRFDLDRRPFLVLLEVTRACDLACIHCRAESCPTRHPEELTTAEIRGVLDDLASLGPPRPMVVLTGGDPFKRPDLIELVDHGSRHGLAMAVAPSGTPLATRANLQAVRAAGARTVSFSLDGATESDHDAFRGVPGSFSWTVGACRSALEVGLRLQINTTVTPTNVRRLPAMVSQVRSMGANLWSVFFVIPTGRGRQLERLSAEETEDVLHFLYEASSNVPLKTTEAPHYRRVLLERRSAEGPKWVGGDLYHSLATELRDHDLSRSPTGPRHSNVADPPRRSPLVVGDGRGVVFVSHLGEVSPSGFLPVATGNVRHLPLTQIYRTSPLLRALRDRSRLRGGCGRCEFRDICGGSRAQAFAESGDPLSEDPTCVLAAAR